MFLEMAKRVQGEVPGVALSLVKNKCRQALGKIYDEYAWSFQTGYAGWLVPGQVANQGTFTVNPFQNTVTADLFATQAVQSVLVPTNPPITQMQYRDPARAIYNIVGLGGNGQVAYATIASGGSGQTPGTYNLTVQDANVPAGTGGQIQVVVDGTGAVTQPPVVLSAGSAYVAPFVVIAAGGTPAAFNIFQFAVLTLDRPWMEPTTGPGQPYMIYQCYFPSPVEDWRRFMEMRDTTNARRIDFWSYSQKDLAYMDPQRMDFSDPNYVVPWGVDQRPNSSTEGYMLFELWPHQLSRVPYAFSYKRRGPQLKLPTDKPPYPITEDLVEKMARNLLYEYKEAQKAEKLMRGERPIEPNWLALKQLVTKEFAETLVKIQANDLNFMNDQLTRVYDYQLYNGEPFSNRQGGLNVGGYPQ